MTYKTILVHVDNGKFCPARLNMAIDLARRFESHLVGLHALTAVRLPAYAIAEAGATLLEAQKTVAREQASRAKKLFTASIKGAGLASTEWRVSSDDAADAMTLHARYADLIVLGQSRERDGSGVESDFAERVILAAGRPVLMVPYAGKFEGVGKRVLVAWDTGREATRAVTDSIPLLREAEQVHVVAFNPEGTAHGAVPGADIGLYLARLATGRLEGKIEFRATPEKYTEFLLKLPLDLGPLLAYRREQERIRDFERKGLVTRQTVLSKF